MSQAWLAQRERGTLAAIRTMAWITRRIGYGAGRALLHPICAYFILFPRRSRRASRDYLARVLGRDPSWREVYRHYHTFAASLLDRVLLVAGRVGDFELDVTGGSAVAQALARRRGCLMLGSHLGSFELCRAAADTQPGIVVNVVMHEGNAGKIVAWMREAAPEHAARVVTPGRPETMLELRDAFARGEIVAMLGDRPIGHSPTVAIDFLGAPARFPAGPLRLALALDVPVVLFFALFRGPRRYELHFEPMSTVAEAQGTERLRALVERYARRLEAFTRAAPYNWFNFYDFWDVA